MGRRPAATAEPAPVAPSDPPALDPVDLAGYPGVLLAPTLPWTPERALLFAVVVDALWRARNGGTAEQAWFADDADPAVVPFPWVCEALGLELTAVRRQLVEEARGRRVQPRRQLGRSLDRAKRRMNAKR